MSEVDSSAVATTAVATTVATAPLPAPAPSDASAKRVSDEDKENLDEVSLVGEFEGLAESVERLIKRSGSEEFLKMMQKSFAVHTAKELRVNVYEIIKHTIIRGGMVAQAFENLEEDFEDLQKEVIDQGRIIRDLVSTSIVGLSWNLARLCLERSQDGDIRNLAQTIFNAMTPATNNAIAAKQEIVNADATPSAGTP